jgi:hypothetical protein
MVLVCFVFHMVDGANVAMHLALTLLKLEDCASNMATRSQLAAWMVAAIRALCKDFAKDTDPAVVAMSSIGCSCTKLPKFKCHMYVMKHKQNIPLILMSHVCDET